MNKPLLLVLLIFLSLSIHAQVSINNDGSVPHASAMLEVKASTTSNAKGFLVPKVADHTSITSPAAGLWVYNTTTNTHWYYNGTTWVNLGGSQPWLTNGTSIFSPSNTALGNYSVAMGNNSTASSTTAFAAGHLARALGNYSTALGYNTAATSTAALAAGYSTQATGNYSTALGYNTAATNTAALAAGYSTRATGEYSTALGYNTTSTGLTALATGYLSQATGMSSTALGYNTSATGMYSTALGYNTTATSTATFAAGYYTKAIGYSSTALGAYTIALGQYSTSFGGYTQAVGNYSIAVGSETIASGFASTAFGSTTLASGSASTAFGSSTQAGGYYTTAMGSSTTATSTASLAAGYYSTSSGFSSMALGGYARASGAYSIAMGYNSAATNTGAFASGGFTLAIGAYSTAMGSNTFASSTASFASGFYSSASGDYSTVMGSNVDGNNKEGGFVIGDSYNNSSRLYANTNNSFSARFRGGYRLFTDSFNSIGVMLNAGANSWSIISDSTRKEKFVYTDGEYVLRKIALLKVGSWNYKGQNPEKNRHYGPMAQEFFAAFGKDKYGTIGDNTSIGSADFDGINLIAIQALEKRTKDLQTENDILKKRLASLEKNEQQMASLKSELADIKALLLQQKESRVQPSK